MSKDCILTAMHERSLQKHITLHVPKCCHAAMWKSSHVHVTFQMQVLGYNPNKLSCVQLLMKTIFYNKPLTDCLFFLSKRYISSWKHLRNILGQVTPNSHMQVLCTTGSMSISLDSPAQQKSCKGNEPEIRTISDQNFYDFLIRNSIPRVLLQQHTNWD